MTVAALMAFSGGQIFPSLRGSVATSTQTSGATFSVTLPTHQANDWILVEVSVESDDNSNVLSVNSGGFTEVGESTGGVDVNIAVYAKQAAGSSETLVLNNSIGKPISAHAYAIKDGDGVEAAFTSSDTSNPPSLTASWGQMKNLWFVGGANGAGGNFSGAPSGFSGFTENGDLGAKTSSAYKEDEVATLNPGAFSGAGGGQEAGCTVVVRPT